MAVESSEIPKDSIPPPKRKSLAKWAPLFLLLVLLLAGYFRFTGIDWDQSYHLHPDERFLTEVAGLLKSTDPLSYLKTSESSLNPYNVGKSFYVYGNFPMTATRLGAEIADSFCQRFQSICQQRFIFYDGIHLVGRFLSALVDLISILITYLIGKRLYDWRAGILAAILMAVTVLSIQQSHFFTMDNWAAALTMLTLYFAIRASEEGYRFRWWALFGLSLGLAVASRINVAPLALLAVIAAVVWLARRSRESGQNQTWRYMQSSVGSSDFQKAILGVIIAAVFTVITFRIAQPYAFADATIVRETAVNETGQLPGPLETAIRSLIGFNPQWRDNMAEIQGLQSPEASFPPATQWTSRTPIIFPLTNMVLWGMGLPLGIAAILSFFWALSRIIRRLRGWESHLLLVTWAGTYFLFMATRWVKSVRYFLPIYPVLILLVGWALVELWKKAGKNRLRQILVAVLVLIVAVPTFLWANAFLDIYRQPVSRVAASSWIFENVPTGAALLYESDGTEKNLNLPLRQFEFQTAGAPLFLNFSIPDDAEINGFRFNYLNNLEPESLNSVENEMLIRIIDGSAGIELHQQVFSFKSDQERKPVDIELPSIPVDAGKNYTISIELTSGGPLLASTSVIANEHWDDPLPVRFEGMDPFSSYYQGLSSGLIPITIPDTEEKREDLISWIDEADYIILSSQRAVWSLPRIPRTYPLTIRYYDALFGGELGFDLVNQFQGNISIGPINISDVGAKVSWNEPPIFGWPPAGDLAAEEAFSVYDHPPVWIFAKGENYSLETSRQILEAVDLSDAVFMTPGQATRAPSGMLLSEEEFLKLQEQGSFSSIFSVDGLLSRNPWLAAIIWWAAVTLLSLIGFPLSSVVFRGLPDLGYPLARILSLLIIAYLGWIAASLKILPNSIATLALATVFLLLLSGAILIFRGQEIKHFIKANRQYIIFVELFGLALYLFFILIRLGNPDVWDVIWGGEKPMDLAYFTATLKSSSFPPYDPWFTGGYINYYYYGFVYIGALTKMLGIVPTTAYNLILPMLFSFTGTAAFSTAYNLVARRNARNSLQQEAKIWARNAVSTGILAAALCVLLGNLAEVPVTLNAWRLSSDSNIDTGISSIDAIVKTVDGAQDVIFSDKTIPIYPGDWFWSASRAISVEQGEVQPITEFPFFTFLYGDLHAHMIALPITIFALAWAVSLALIPGQEGAGGRSETRKWQLFLILVIGALAVGSLWATNSWDYPTYLGLASLALVYFAFRKRRDVSLFTAAVAIGYVLLFAGLSILFFLPFTTNFGQAYSSFSLWQGSYTTTLSYLAVYGLFLFIVVIYLYGQFRSWTATWTVESLAKWEPYVLIVFGVLLVAILTTAILILRGYTIALIVMPLILCAGLLSLRSGIPIEQRILLILTAAAFTLTLLVEIIVLDGDIGRMNTVFKFYLQTWVMLSIVGGAAVIWVSNALRYRSLLRRLWYIGLTLLIAAAALYPILATKAKWDIRMSEEAPHTLDGMAFMKTTSYSDTAFDGTPATVELGYDYDAIRWIQRNIEGSPVIAEANSSNPYRSIGNRVSMYTGLPTIIGWDWHQRQQRALMPGNLVTDRIIDVNTLYNTTDIQEALGLLEKYNVRYVYAGPLEWIYYQPQGLIKFDEMEELGFIEEVYRNGGVSIYEVISIDA